MLDGISEMLGLLKDAITGKLIDIKESFILSIGVLGNKVSDLKDDVLNILNYLNPFHENFFLKLAFVPRDGYFESKYQQIQSNINSKLSFFDNIKSVNDSIEQAFQSGSSGEPPQFVFFLPSKYGGGEVKIIDFSMYNQYRTLIHSLIIMVSYYWFVKRIIRRLPQVIHSGG